VIFAAALGRRSQAAFALACAQGAVGPEVEQLGALDAGWNALASGADVAQILKRLSAAKNSTLTPSALLTMP
jgi:hypothetical protein